MRTLIAAAGIATFLALAGTTPAQDNKGTAVEWAGMKSTAPADWKNVPLDAKSMRMYTFKLPKADGDPEDAELAVFFLRGNAGSVEDNLKRQVAKFQAADGKDKVEEKKDKVKVGTYDATYQEVGGTFLRKPFPMAEKGTPVPGFKQLYVIFETKDGLASATLLGPTKTIDKHKKAFDEWVKNFK